MEDRESPVTRTENIPPNPPNPLDHVSDDAAADFLSSLIEPKETMGYAQGEMIGPFELRGKLGDGGFGIVWLAEQSQPIRRRVALKILKLGMDTVEVVARFEQERESLALMEHPNIARVLDAGATAEGRPYFAMELVDGPPITHYCQRKSLSLEDRLRLFSDVCAGVQHAHQKGIIHRDLKPSNILVTEVDGAPVPKIIDFGIAKATTMDRLTDYTYVTRHDQLMGSPVYMSPEQADAHPDIDTRSDIYALGALLYELITGAPPFDAATLHAAGYMEMRRIIREVEPKPPSRTHGGEQTTTLLLRSTDLDVITRHALEKNREHRYATAAALQEDVQRFLHHEPILARPPSALYLFARWARRHRVLTSAGAITLIAMIAGGIAIWQQKQEAEKQARDANTMLQMLLVTTVWETDKIDTVGLSKLGPALALAASKVDSLPPYSDERMRLGTGVGKAYLCLENWPLAIRYINDARQTAIRNSAPYRTIRELSEIHCYALIKCDRCGEALAHVEKLIPEFDRELYPDDPSIFYIRQLKAQALSRLSRHAESLATYQEIFTLIKKWPGTPRPMDIVGVYMTYPEALRLSGDPAAALKAARENVNRAQRSLGEIDTQYADVLAICAHECSLVGEHKEADEYLDWAWQVYLDTYGPAHIVTRRLKNALLITKQKLGLTEEAQQIWQDTVETYQSESGKTDPATLEASLECIDFLHENKKIKAAIKLAEQALQDLQSVTPPTAESIEWQKKLTHKLTEIKGP